MDKPKYMIFLKSPIDTALREILGQYIVKKDNIEFIICSEWEQNGAFIYLKASNSQSETSWGINIPFQTVLAIANFSDTNPIGFNLKRAQSKSNS